MGAGKICLECLQQRIQSDFSDKVIFRYGICDSALPFASRAVIQIKLNSGEDKISGEEVSPQFLLVLVPDCEGKYSSEYVDGYPSEKTGDDNLCRKNNATSCIEQCQAEGNGVLNDETVSLAFRPDDCQHSVTLSSTTPATMEAEISSIGCSHTCLCSRTITALAPVAYVGIGSYAMIKDLVCKYLSDSIEDHIMSSLNLLVDRKPTDQDGANFLSLVGFPKFTQGRLCGYVRHPNIVPVLGMLKAPGYVNVLYPKPPYTLENILHYSPKVLKSDWHIRFLIYQILSALANIHGLGVAHGDLCPSTIMLTDSCWSWVSMSDKHQAKQNLTSGNKKESAISLPMESCCMEDCSSLSLHADLKLSPCTDWHSDFMRWWTGELSNYDYLLVLNRLAGRRWGDHAFHVVMPWVIDFSVKPEEGSDAGWRDLRKSKWRLAKGDEQLDFTYATSEIPHHVSDECLSELAVCSYKARRLPLSVLRSAVRSVYEPNEYPSNMQRLYQWTPDECIPEFYSDSRIFTSLHSGMSDLVVPAWATSPEEFISLHRAALESNRVSREIHHWIDITFGYKMSGKAAVAAKNVMLPMPEPMMPRSVGRCQLFTRPHPMRRALVTGLHYTEPPKLNHQLQGKSRINSKVISKDFSDSALAISERLLSEMDYLEKLEEATSFCEYGRNLNPCYTFGQEKFYRNVSSEKGPENKQFKTSIPEMSGSDSLNASDIALSSLLEYLEADDSVSTVFQELLRWRQKSSLESCSEDAAQDIFSVGCILAELYLKRSLFDPVSLSAYRESSILPGLIEELPSDAKLLVETCIQRDWKRRPSAISLLESPYFPSTVRSAYLFLAPLQLLAKNGSHLHYAAKFAKEGALKYMGTFAAEMCAPYCLPLIMAPLSDFEAESALCLLMEFLKCLKPQAIKTLILPAIQKILQATDYSHLKVFLLQNSFVHEVWKQLGKQVYLEKIHPLVISNLYVSPHKNSASAASVLLIGSCEELGVPVTVNQTILPIIHCFGKGICTDGIDALVRIGGLLGENFVIRHLLPLLRNVILSCIDVSSLPKPEPLQSWNALSLIDSLVALDGLAAVLPKEAILKELIQEQICPHVKVLTQTQLDLPVLQVAATTLIAVCQKIGPDSTALHILPQLKDLFDELAFSQETTASSGSFGKNLKFSRSQIHEEVQIESRMDLVLLLYPFFASLLGIEKLRQCCATWLLLEQFLQHFHNWKWVYSGETSRIGADNINAQRPVFNEASTSDYNPAKLLLNGVGWSIPQSQGVRGGKSSTNYKLLDNTQQAISVKHVPVMANGKQEPWFWFPSPAAGWDGPDFLGRVGGIKDELPWKIRSSIVYSVRAHPGALRTLAVCDDECTIFTGGVGPGFKGTVQKWELTRMDCISGYYGHEEVVNDICLLSAGGRVASCDGTIHVWNSQTGKLISVYAEPSTNPLRLVNSLSTASKVISDQSNMLNSNTLSAGILSTALSTSLYTCMHYLESEDKLVAGMGNGSLRFIDIVRDQKLHLWKSDAVEYSLLSVVSAICFCGSEKLLMEGVTSSPSWIAAGLSSGHCRLLDARSGNVISFWRAHDGYITKLAAPEDHLLVSSSLDRTLRVWDLRRNCSSQLNIFRGHSYGISSFSIWGQDVISVSKNKIGLSSLFKSADEDGERQIRPQKLYMSDGGMINLSVLSSIRILPFSRQFLVGTEDGYLKICC